MFLHTLGYNNDKVVKCVLSARVNDPTLIAPPVFKRGKHRPSNVLDRDLIEAHINSYHPQISHYRREHAPRRRYLSPEITITEMFHDYNSKHPKKCSYDSYRKVVDKENISFCKLGEEECEVCLLHANHV